MKQQVISILKAMKRKAEIKRWTWCGYMIETLDEAIDRIQSLPESNWWIPVSERLPENSNDIIMRWTFWFVKTAIWRYHHTGENWFVLPNQIGFYKTETVTHWMPLPESPK